MIGKSLPKSTSICINLSDTKRFDDGSMQFYVCYVRDFQEILRFFDSQNIIALLSFLHLIWFLFVWIP